MLAPSTGLSRWYSCGVQRAGQEAGLNSEGEVVGTAPIVCLGLQQPRQCCRLLGKLLRIGFLKLPQVVKLPANAGQLLHLQQRPVGLVRYQREKESSLV